MPQPDILALLPHRAPMLMVDRVLELGEDGCRALKHISYAEPCFRGHFPNDPIFPGVLIVEALAQTCALWLSSGGEGGLPIFAGIASAVFRRKVRPGDALVLSARLISERKGFYTFQTQAEVEGQCVCSAELTVCQRNSRPEDQSKSSVAVGKPNADMGGMAMTQIDEQGRAVRQIVPLEGMRKVIAERMTFSKHEYPQGTGQVHLEVSKIIRFRQELMEKKGIKVSFGDLYVKAAACALEENMALNASRQDGKIVYYEDININVLASFNGVLMEPVLEHADQKNIEEISAELKKTYEYLKKGKLMRVKLEGGTFSVSNMGASLIDSQQPFISPPQGAIMGVSRNRRVPVFGENDVLVPANLTNFALTIDHGLCDGSGVTSFFASLDKVLQDPWNWMYHKRPAAGET